MRPEPIPPSAAEAELARAIADLALGHTRDAISEASSAVFLDPELHARALVVVRMCIRRELANGSL